MDEVILVVDDEPVVRELVKRKLEGDGFTVTTAATAAEAVEALSSGGGIGVILSDIRMPGMSGIDLLKKAKEIDPSIEVIIMTGFATTESAIEAVQLGAFDYLKKPFSHVNVVTEKVRGALERRRSGGEGD